MQRIRVKYNRGEAVKFIAHLDMMRLWERALRRAGVPLSYSQGFSPHPQISQAAPLSVGVTSETELMDVFLFRNVTPQWFNDAVNQQLPDGIRILQSQQIAPVLPSLQSIVRFAEYRVEITTDRSREEIETSINKLLALEHLPWQHQRDTGTKSYDLRALVDTISLVDKTPEKCIIKMKLRCDNSGTGRPEQVIAALGFTGYPVSIHRINLYLENNK